MQHSPTAGEQSSAPLGTGSGYRGTKNWMKEYNKINHPLILLQK